MSTETRGGNANDVVEGAKANSSKARSGDDDADRGTKGFLLMIVALLFFRTKFATYFPFGGRPLTRY